MRVLIGYDGQEVSDAVMEDVRRAGLGEDGVEARVMTVASECGVPADPAFEKRSPRLAWVARDQRESALREAADVARRGADRLRAVAPGWTIESSSLAGVAHRVLIEAAEAWPADLLVVGSHSRGLTGRLFHGSVAQMCVNHCRRSVRIARRGARADVAGERETRILIADDGSPTAEGAIEMVAARRWPARTRAWVVFVAEMPVPARPAELGPEGSVFIAEVAEIRRDVLEYGQELTQTSASKIEAAGLSATPVVLEGHPRYAINEFARREQVDCVFLGARGHGTLERLLLGSVAAGVAAGAPCSVEVMRPEWPAGAD